MKNNIYNLSSGLTKFSDFDFYKNPVDEFILRSFAVGVPMSVFLYLVEKSRNKKDFSFADFMKHLAIGTPFFGGINYIMAKMF